MAISRTPSGRYRRMMSVLFSSVLLLRKSPNFVRDPVSPASLSLGASASSKACKRPHHHLKAWPDVQHVCQLTFLGRGLVLC